MKPDTSTAMRVLIAEVRATIPFTASQSRICTGACDRCSRKLLDFLEGELADWERRLDGGEAPKLGDVTLLARTSHKVYAVLQCNGLVSGGATD